MVLELIIVGLLGIGATLAGVFAANYLTERREKRKLKLEEWKMVIDEVYSPLIFDLQSVREGFLSQLLAIDKTFTQHSERFTKEEVANSINLIALISGRIRQSPMLEDILRKKSRLIKPSSLWLDLFLFYSYLNEIEDIFSIIGVGRFSDSPDKLLAAIQNCVYVGKKLEEAASHLRLHVGKITVSTEEMPKSLSYTPFFNQKVIEELEEKHQSLLNVLLPEK